jgi:hypothetical protein
MVVALLALFVALGGSASAIVIAEAICGRAIPVKPLTTFLAIAVVAIPARTGMTEGWAG